MLELSEMPRRLLKRLTPSRDAIHANRWLRPFKHFLTDPRLWSPQRRTVAPAFGAGLAISFVPLPLHLVLATLVASVARVNVPTIIATVFLSNPLTLVPMFYFAYRVGAVMTGFQPQPFAFSLSWDWLQNGLGPLWQPFLIGCLICSIVFGLVGWLTVDVAWRTAVRRRMARRRARARARLAALRVDATDESPLG